MSVSNTEDSSDESSNKLDILYNLFRPTQPEKQNENKLDPHIFDRNAENYKMNHERRGQAIIFNNFFCNCKSRTKKEILRDINRLEYILSNYLKFEVITYTDLLIDQILEILKKTSKRKFNDEDCIAVFVLTYGTLEKLTARDMTYSIEDLWQDFTPGRCSTLSGKPKLFFINTCLLENYGKKTIFLENLQTKSKDIPALHTDIFRLPLYTDFLTYYSMVQVKKPTETITGIWFIKIFCDIFEANDIRNLELKKILTIVTREVTAKCNKNPETFHTPTLLSTLIRNIYFEK